MEMFLISPEYWRVGNSLSRRYSFATFSGWVSVREVGLRASVNTTGAPPMRPTSRLPTGSLLWGSLLTHSDEIVTAVHVPPRLGRYIQGGKKLREHHFLACLKRKYSDSVMLLVAYVSPITYDAIANPSRHAGHQCKAHPAKSQPMPPAAAWWAARRWKLFATRWRSPTESPRGFQWNWPLCRSQVKHIAPRKEQVVVAPILRHFGRAQGISTGHEDSLLGSGKIVRVVTSRHDHSHISHVWWTGNSKHVIVCLGRSRTPLQIGL